MAVQSTPTATQTNHDQTSTIPGHYPIVSTICAVYHEEL